MNTILNFKVSSGSLVVTDPCYINYTDGLEDCAVGNWCATIDTEHSSVFGERVSKLRAYHTDHEGVLANEFVFNVVVDSGMAGIMDLKYYPHNHSASRNKFYTELCERLETGKVVSVKTGVFSRSGYGDGDYPCFVGMFGDKVVAIEIVFIGDTSN